MRGPDGTLSDAQRAPRDGLQLPSVATDLDSRTQQELTTVRPI